MRGVYFDDKHTGDDWNLILNSKSIDPPAPKYVKISVDGRNGDLNLSRALTGDISYANREVNYTFIATEGTQEEREALISQIVNYCHGQERKIIDPDYPDYYFIGEITVSNIRNDRAYGTFTISGDCEPFKYSVEEINRLISLTSTESVINLTNGGTKTLIPTVTVDGNANIKIGNDSVSLGSGTYKLTALRLPSGSTPITVSGSGTLTLTYREAIL